MVNIDGVFLLTVGVFFVRSKNVRRNVRRQALGYFLIGGACLTRQGFVLTIPIFWLLFGAWRDWRFIVISLLPGALYVLFLLVTDAFADAWFQMVALGGVFAELAVKNILAIPSIVGFYHRCNDNLCLAYPRWRLANICRYRSRRIIIVDDNVD